MIKSSTLQHLIDIKSLNREHIIKLINNAQENINLLLKPQASSNILAGHIVANLFFEPSTRTCNSFTIAAKRLGALVLNPDMSFSSTQKGESLLDTIHTFEAMGAGIIVLRHQHNFSAEFVAHEVGENTVIINAGDGQNQHPTQALIDILTMRQHCKRFPNINVAIVGDIKHSRVAHSLIDALSLLDVNSIRIIAPNNFHDKNLTHDKISQHTDLKSGMQDADVVVTLRIQHERLSAEETVPKLEKYYQAYGITTDVMSYAKPDAIVLHPGPINRGVEIESAVADGPQSRILNQVTNGVALRMAVMEMLASA